MAAPKPKDPLDALQDTLNDAFVQTGKALRASCRDSQGNPPPNSLQHPKLPETIQYFHAMLDEIEGHILRAKSALLRDLNQLQADKNMGQQSQSQALPMDSSRMNFGAELDSSPPPLMPSSTTLNTKPASAPFPVMNAQDMTNEDSAIKIEDSSLPLLNKMTDNIVMMEKDGAPEAPMAANANFTDMEFSLAPADALQNQGAEAGSFDMSAYAPQNGAMLSLDNLLPNNSNGNRQSADAMAATADTSAGPPPMTAPEAAKTEPAKDGVTTADASFDDFFGNDATQADGMDFDFSIGGTGGGTGGGIAGNAAAAGGMGEDTFDDLMNDRDGTFEMMANDDFDAAFFGMENNKEVS